MMMAMLHLALMHWLKVSMDYRTSTVHVVAPLTNQSGGGGNTTKPPYVVSGSAVTTLSGRPATAVSSKDPARQPAPKRFGWPADAVIYALKTMLLSPELVVSGINQGQNMGSVTPSVRHGGRSAHGKEATVCLRLQPARVASLRQ